MNSPQVLSLLRKEKQTKFYKGKRERERERKQNSTLLSLSSPVMADVARMIS
jgi:hypothetical protein